MIFFKKKFYSFDECIKSRYGKYLMRKYGYNGLHLCIFFNMPQWIDKLKNISLLKNEKNFSGLTPLFLAMWLNRKECLKKLNFYYDQKIKVVKNDETKYLTIQAFEKFFGIEYLQHLEFSSPFILNKIIKRIQKADRKNQITQEEKWLGAYYKDDIILNNCSDILIKWIDAKKGYGLFANNNLKKKKFIGQYSGYLRYSSPRKDQKNAYCFEYITGYKCPENFTIDARLKGNITRFINHSYQSNLKPTLIFIEPVLLIGFLTNQEIKEGDELTYNYGPDYWRKRENPC
jgi:uncharacterized protein